MEKKIQADYRKYQDPSGGLTSKELDIGTWYVRNKAKILQIILYFFVVFDSILGVVALLFWGSYVFFGYFEDKRMMQDIVNGFKNYEDLQSNYSAIPIVGERTTVAENGKNTYDIVTYIKNSNDRWIGEIFFSYLVGGTKTDVGSAVILPKSVIPVGLFGFESVFFPVNPSFQIERTEWKRIDPHDVFSVQDFIKQRHVFSFDNLIFTRKDISETGVSAHTIAFDLYNDSAYSYWNAFFVLELYNGGSKVGVIPFNIPSFKSQTMEHVEIRTFLDIFAVNDIIIIPVTNVFDQQSFMEPAR